MARELHTLHTCVVGSCLLHTLHMCVVGSCFYYNAVLSCADAFYFPSTLDYQKQFLGKNDRERGSQSEYAHTFLPKRFYGMVL